MRYRRWIVLAASILLGLVFLTSGIGKLLGHSAFLLSISNLTFFPRPVEIAIVDVLPWVELALGVLLLAGVATQPVAFIACVLAACFIFQNSWMVLHGMKNEPCSCFGILERVLSGRLSTLNALYIDIAMLALALAAYTAYTGPFREWRPWSVLYRRQPTPRVQTPAGE
jgi:uncharacterized membrane protein YphA (DoxX/SURF4 family)